MRPARPIFEPKVTQAVTEILFYHLESIPLEKVLPQLLEKSLERGWKAVVEASSQERLETLDAALWTYRDDSFLPHGIEGIDAEADADTPVLLTCTNTNPNGAQIRLFVDRAVPAEPLGYERVAYIFDGHDPDAVTEAREAWKVLKNNHTLTYWQQDPSGRWQKKA